MRLAFFDDRHDEVYGGQENLLLLARLAADRGHDVICYTTASGRFLDSVTERALRGQVVPAPAPLLVFQRRELLRRPLGLARMIAAWLSYSLRLSRAIRSSGAELVMASSLRSCLMLWILAPWRRPKVALYAQNSIPLGAQAALGALICDRICLIGRGAAPTFPRIVRSVLARRFVVLPSGRDLARFAPVAEQASGRLPDGAVRVVTIASISPRKGIHILTDAVARVRAGGHDVRLTVVGSTIGQFSQDYLAELKRSTPGWESWIDFAGWHDDVVPFLHAADVFALASFDEGLPGVLIEAMAAGLACVTTDVGSAGELVRECGGLDVPVGDVAAFAAALERYVVSPDERLAAGTAARQRVQVQYTLEAFGERFETMMKGLVTVDHGPA